MPDEERPVRLLPQQAAQAHRQKRSTRFRAHLHGKRVICLDIADDYVFMDPELVGILKSRVPEFLTTA
jgi:predicted protein tyrosine phosphatase